MIDGLANMEVLGGGQCQTLYRGMCHIHVTGMLSKLSGECINNESFVRVES